MSDRIILVSNRLPFIAEYQDKKISLTPSIGGLATGLRSVRWEKETLWIGWSGLPREELEEPVHLELEKRLREEHRCIPVSLSQKEIREFYGGFCNNILWPLFHYFPGYVDYDSRLWAAYVEANRRFAETLRRAATPRDTIWIHDYQLMLLPLLAREIFPEARIGFFLHIPFPSFELFRLLPWRKEILEGLLGADLIGFHVHDYARHFLDSVRRLLGLDHHLGQIRSAYSVHKVDVFPMGIDPDRFASPSVKAQQRILPAFRSLEGQRVILSVDRLDYSKGIPQRLRGFSLFLEQHPEFRERVTLMLLVAPSRIRVPQYAELRRQVEELVSTINGRYGTFSWIPIRYLFRSFPIDTLTALYKQADILMITPLRDGMNLIAKEYVSARSDGKGMLILSETAGAAWELGEALIVNPNNVEEIASAIPTALNMPDAERRERLGLMQTRLKRYDIHSWASHFLEKLADAVRLRIHYLAHKLSPAVEKALLERYLKAERRLILLDYDGTLIPFFEKPAQAQPDPPLLDLLERLAANPRNEVVLASGRCRRDLEEWFGSLPLNLVTDHGVWCRSQKGEWTLVAPVSGTWKKQLKPVLELFRDRTPGALVEEKEYSLAWHYRRSDPELAALRVSELKDALLHLIGNTPLAIMEGKRVLEVKQADIHKGRAVSLWLARESWGLILAAGDDWTDEETFAVLPPEAFSIKIGYEPSQARFCLESPAEMRALLARLLESG